MRIDGATEWGTLWRLAFPLTRPALVTVTIYNGARRSGTASCCRWC